MTTALALAPQWLFSPNMTHCRVLVTLVGTTLLPPQPSARRMRLNAVSALLPGRIRMIGTPAEERGGGKELMARAGAFEGVDAAMMIHPAGVNLRHHAEYLHC